MPDVGLDEVRVGKDAAVAEDVVGGDAPRSDLTMGDSSDVEPEATVEVGEDWGGNCHLDCWGGPECWGGNMHAAAAIPPPCPAEDCFAHGSSWPCVSGVCGEFELCADDDAYLSGLVPENSEWSPGTFVRGEIEPEFFEGHF